MMNNDKNVPAGTVTCQKAPDGRHCYHSTNETSLSWPYERRCCHCGQNESSEHGPFYPHRRGGVRW